MINELNERSRAVFRQLVDAYVETGAPVGSRSLSSRLGMNLSPATIRNVMADLEKAGLLYAPHTSAGRLPTSAGMRLFVDGLLEFGDLSEADRREIEERCAAAGKSLPGALDEASHMLSGLSAGVGLVSAPTPSDDRSLRHIEFTSLGPGRALVVTVTDDGLVENRVIDVPHGMPATSLQQASNYLNDRLIGRTLEEAHGEIQQEIEEHRAQLDALAQRVVEAGIATWSHEDGSIQRDDGVLIVRGQANLLEDVKAIEDLESIRSLFEQLETKESMLKLLGETQTAEGVQIYIGADNDLFNITGLSMVVAPYADTRRRLVGAIGVIGPMRLNYARIVPMVDYTAKVISRLLG
jgi:heat-inducible transcriptional repressor